MRRRTLLAVSGACVVAIAGCGGNNPSGESTPDHSQSRAAFESAVKQDTNYVQRMALNGTDWTIEYSHDGSAGDTFEDHQAALARNFSNVGPENVSLTATTFHECMDIHWEIPAELAREHREGEIDNETYVRRVQNTTVRENLC